MNSTYETECECLRKKFESLLLLKTDRRTLKCLVLTYRYRQFLTENGPESRTETIRRQKAEEIRIYLADFPEVIKDCLETETLMVRIEHEAAAASGILGHYQKELKACSQSAAKYLYHVTARKDLAAVAASHRRPNMYHTSDADAVFATSSRAHALLYAGRVLAGDMRVLPAQRMCIYRSNPFQCETRALWKLRHPVWICLLEYDHFIPVVDFVETRSGGFRICFEHEWTAFRKEEPVTAVEHLEALDKKLLPGYRFYIPDPAGHLKRIG